MKKKLLTILSLGLVFVSTTTIFAKVPVSQQNIVFDGNPTDTKGYIIKDNNYFKLRDVAALLAGTEASFGVRYNQEKNRVEITRDGDYTPTADDLKPLADTESKPLASAQEVRVDGEKIGFNVYSIDGYNYFKLRDLGKVIGFYVDYDEKKDQVLLNSEKLEGKSLVTNQVKVKVRDFATDASSHMQKFTTKEKPKLSIEDFLKQMKSIVLLTENHGQVSAHAEYEEESHRVIMRPTMGKYSGSLYYVPYLAVEQEERYEIYPYQGEFNVTEFLEKNNFNKDKKFLIIMGYYIGEEMENNFRTLSTIEYN